MKKVTLAEVETEAYLPIMLEDFSLFESKMAKTRAFKEMKQYADKSLLRQVIDELGFRGKKMTAKRVRKVYKRILLKMIEEVGR